MSLSGNEVKTAAHGKVNVCEEESVNVPYREAELTGNIGFMNFARKPFLLTSSR